MYISLYLMWSDTDRLDNISQFINKVLRPFKKKHCIFIYSILYLWHNGGFRLLVISFVSEEIKALKDGHSKFTNKALRPFKKNIVFLYTLLCTCDTIGVFGF